MSLLSSVVACCLPPPTSAAPPRLLNNKDHRPRTVGRRYPSMPLLFCPHDESLPESNYAASDYRYHFLCPRLPWIELKRPRAQEQRARHSRRHLPLQAGGCLSGTKPSYLGVQKNPPSLALCPATNNCVSTSEKISDSNHYAPPWNYNPNDGRRGKPISKDEAMKELIEVVTKTKPDNFSPRVVEKGDDYIRVEYESPIFGFVDDVEFWFPPGKKSIVQYRSASRSGFIDFNANKKRVKALRLALEKKGWASESSF